MAWNTGRLALNAVSGVEALVPALARFEDVRFNRTNWEFMAVPAIPKILLRLIVYSEVRACLREDALFSKKARLARYSAAALP